MQTSGQREQKKQRPSGGREGVSSVPPERKETSRELAGGSETEGMERGPRWGSRDQAGPCGRALKGLDLQQQPYATATTPTGEMQQGLLQVTGTSRQSTQGGPARRELI